MARGITIEVRGTHQVVEVLTKAQRAGQDFTDVWEQSVIPFLQMLEERQFSSEGAAGEPPAWAPLSERYAVKKFRQFGARPLMVRTDALRSSLTHRTANSIREVKPQSLTFGSSLLYPGRYGYYNAMGFISSGGREVPPRKALALRDEDLKAVSSLVAQRYAERIRRAKS